MPTIEAGIRYATIGGNPMATRNESKPVELFQRAGGWVAAGDAEQWAMTHELLQQHQYDPESESYRYRLDRLVDQAYEAIFRADDYGRMSIELFASEAEIMRAVR